MNIATSYLFLGFGFHIKILPFKYVNLNFVFSSATEGKKRGVTLWEKTQRGEKGDQS